MRALTPLGALVLLAGAGCRDAGTPGPGDARLDGPARVDAGQDARLSPDGAGARDACRDAPPERRDAPSGDVRDGVLDDADGDADAHRTDTSSDVDNRDAEAGTDARPADARRDAGGSARDAGRDGADAADARPADAADGGPPDAPLLPFERYRDVDALQCPPGEWPAPVLPPLARGVPEEAELGVKWVLGPGMLTDLFEGAPPLRPFDPHHGLILTLDGGVCTASLFHTWAGWEKPACFDPAGRLRWSSSGQFGLATNPVLITAPDGRLYWTAGDGVMETAPRQEGLWEERVLLSANLLPFRPAVADLQVGPSGTLLAFQEWFPVLLSRCGERIWGIEQVMVPALSTVGSSVLNPTREAGISHEVSAAGEVVATYRAPGRTTVVLPVDEGLLMWWEYEPNGEAGIWVGFSAPGEAMPRSLTRVAWGPYLALPDETVVGWSGDPDETLQVLRPGEEPRTLEFDHPAAEPVLGVGPVLARAEDTGRRDPAGAEDCRSRLAVYDLAGALRSAIDVEGVCRAHSPVLAPDGTAYFVARAYVEDVPGDNMWDHLKPVLVAVQTDVPGHAPGISRWPWRDAYGMGSTVADRLASPLP